MLAEIAGHAGGNQVCTLMSTPTGERNYVIVMFMGATAVETAVWVYAGIEPVGVQVGSSEDFCGCALFTGTPALAAIDRVETSALRILLFPVASGCLFQVAVRLMVITEVLPNVFFIVRKPPLLISTNAIRIVRIPAPLVIRAALPIIQPPLASPVTAFSARLQRVKLIKG